MQRYSTTFGAGRRPIFHSLRLARFLLSCSTTHLSVSAEERFKNQCPSACSPNNGEWKDNSRNKGGREGKMNMGLFSLNGLETPTALSGAWTLLLRSIWQHLGSMLFGGYCGWTNCGRCSVEQGIWCSSVLLPLIAGSKAAGQFYYRHRVLKYAGHSFPCHHNSLISAKGCTCTARVAEDEGWHQVWNYPEIQDSRESWALKMEGRALELLDMSAVYTATVLAGPGCHNLVFAHLLTLV